jgi:energy-coupling factor transporter transmembrane protein EcfT
MRIADVDTIAVLGDSALHRIGAPAKLIAFALVLSAVLVTTNVLVIVALTIALIAVVVGLRLPARTLLGFAAYPAIFAALFALATTAGWLGVVLVVGKALCAALAAVLLTFTTPYPHIFAPIQRVLPAILGDSALMTYRSLFLLLDRMDKTLTSVRLRAGRPKSLTSGARMATTALGGVLFYSIDLSQRTYDVMRLRGYEGRLIVAPQASGPLMTRVATVVLAAVLLGVAVVSRVWWVALNPISWLLPVAAAFVLLGAAVARLARTRKDRS